MVIDDLTYGNKLLSVVLIIVGHDERTGFCYRRFLLFCELLRLSLSLNWMECGMVKFVEGQRM
jgi:hypothetical protein